MVDAVRACEAALGDKNKIVDRSEGELRHYAQRSLQVSRAIKKGERISESSLSILRPGKQKKGLHPRYLSSVVGRIARRALPVGRGIGKEDVR
jgi:N-acetylneuraminate synthase